MKQCSCALGVKSMAAKVISFDLCIIGAGVFGSAAAVYASENTALKICLIGPEEPKDEEWKSRTIFSSHYDEGRIVGNLGKDDIKNKLKEKSLIGFQKLEKILNMKLYNPVGCLHLYDFENLNKASGILNQIKINNSFCTDLSSPNLFNKKFPFMSLEGYEKAFFFTNSGHISTRKLLQAQQKVAKMQGCNIVNDIVKDIKEMPNGILQVTTENQDIFNVKKVLICAGAFTNFVSSITENLDITINRETYILAEISENEASRLSSMPTVNINCKSTSEQSKLYGAYILPPIKYPDGKYYLKIGHKGSIMNSELQTLKEIKDWFHSKGEKYIFDFYTKLLKELIPDLQVEAFIRKTCVTCENPSGYPYIDKIASNIAVAAVGNGEGVAMCDEVGRIAANLIIKDTFDSNLQRSHFKVKFKNIL